mgnify:CR=1 FL=1
MIKESFYFLFFMSLGNWCEKDGDSVDGSLSSPEIQNAESAEDDMPFCCYESFQQAENEDEIFPSDPDSSDSDTEPESDTCDLLQQKIVNYLVKIKEENRMPQQTVKNIAYATSHLFKGALVYLQEDLRECLNADNIVLDDIPGAADCFDKVSHCLDGLEKGWIHTTHGKLQCVVSSMTGINFHVVEL